MTWLKDSNTVCSGSNKRMKRYSISNHNILYSDKEGEYILYSDLAKIKADAVRDMTPERLQTLLINEIDNGNFLLLAVCKGVVNEYKDQLEKGE